MDGLSGREEDHEMKELTDDIAAATRKEAKFRKRRDNAARTLMKSGYTSKELAEGTAVQASRVRQYKTAGRVVSGYGSAQEFRRAFDRWQAEQSRLERLLDRRNAHILEEVDRGKSQKDIGKEYGVTQMLVSWVHRTRRDVGML